MGTVSFSQMVLLSLEVTSVLGVAVTCCSLGFYIWEQSEQCVHCRAEHALHLAMHRRESGPGPVPDPTLRCCTVESTYTHQMFPFPSILVLTIAGDDSLRSCL